jgi:hypothetical protein
MAKHLIAYENALTSTATFTKMSPAADTTVYVDGTNKVVQVPRTNLLVGAYAYGANFLLAQITTPSLKANRVPVEWGEMDTTATQPINTVGAIPPFQYFGDTPVALSAGEGLEVDYTGGGTAVGTVGVWLSDGAPDQKVSGPLLHGVRTTSSTTLVANTWTACQLSFDNQLPVGDYAIVGMEAFSATAVLARVAIAGSGWRMGVIGGPITVSTRDRIFRDGRFANTQPGTYESWGAFRSTSPPQVEYFAGAADSSEVVYFDLVKIA